MKRPAFESYLEPPEECSCDPDEYVVNEARKEGFSEGYGTFATKVDSILFEVADPIAALAAIKALAHEVL